MSLRVPAGFQFAHPGYLSGRTYSTYNGPTSSSAIPAIDLIYFYPFILTAPITFTAGQIRVVTGGAGSSVKAGIWGNSTVSQRPLGAPLFGDNTGVLSTSSSANVVVAISGTLGPGFYWAGTKTTGTPPSVISLAAGNNWFAWLAGISGSSLVSNGVSFADTYSNNLPTMAEGASYSLVATAGVPILGLTT